MKITRRIQLPDSPYLFELTLESKTVEAHSLMSDNQEEIKHSLGDDINLRFRLTEMADQHQQKLKG